MPGPFWLYCESHVDPRSPSRDHAIAGVTAPAGKRMGHAGAIIGGKADTAEAKKEILRECGIHVVDSPADIGSKMKEVLG